MTGNRKKNPEINHRVDSAPWRKIVTFAMLLCEYNPTRINDESTPWMRMAVTGLRVRGLRWVKMRGRWRSRPDTKINRE
jgi:hypothetical protein